MAFVSVDTLCTKYMYIMHTSTAFREAPH